MEQMSSLNQLCRIAIYLNSMKTIYTRVILSKRTGGTQVLLYKSKQTEIHTNKTWI